MFATEQILMSLDDLVQDTTDPNIQLDEVEIQKGFLQLARSLEFLHDSNLVHTNLNGKSVLINGKGDWKLSGFGFMVNLNEAESQQAQEDLEDQLPDAMKRNLDYIDPLYALEAQVKPTNDMFSLGILLFMALHHGATPYQTYGSMNALRAYYEQISSKIRSAQWNMLDSDVQGM
ncbi:Protein kinase domain-containing protein ppk32 [Malassezia nana]|uniref:Protein kinase domain-containing protein ppk32 n=1 Tax=Malassezia nana TaxID=180528 RepID=A0AAF0EMS1_9BASI|nr:Protein kinase domain-containing protein ppk32 [Malassezia nana]